jgi:hypothetical protein
MDRLAGAIEGGDPPSIVRHRNQASPNRRTPKYPRRVGDTVVEAQSKYLHRGKQLARAEEVYCRLVTLLTGVVFAVVGAVSVVKTLLGWQ